MAFPKLLQKLFQNNGAGDKLNPDIIPDIPYSKITDAPSITVDSALSDTSENPVQNKIINSALDGKLSLSGGTVSGNITLNGGLLSILKADKNGSLAITGGDCISSGGAGSAILFLGGGDDSSSFNAPGEFSLQASKGTYGQSGFSSYELRGKPNGSLTWGGKSLTGGLTVVAESYSANSWYRKYSDGWIEQGGRVSIPESSSTRVTFLVPFKNTNYTVSSADTENLDALEYTNSVSFGKSTTGLVIKHHNYAAHYDWRAAGF